MVHNYDWSSVYAGAVLESDQRKLSERILDAEIAILPALASQDWRDVSGRRWKLRWMSFRIFG
jgi:hypothetical protein